MASSTDGVHGRRCCDTYAHEFHRTSCRKFTHHGDPKAPVRAETLREAAAALDGGGVPEDPTAVVAWLRERADAIEAAQS